MDEVEAALDDVNLHRFLGLVEEFRQDAQLLIVSHQKRTMEAADCLYGVSMQPGRVVQGGVGEGQRLTAHPTPDARAPPGPGRSGHRAAPRSPTGGGRGAGRVWGVPVSTSPGPDSFPLPV